tara:strand:- start:3243 stop:3443 length:201 start_codon:yes stop_codon:yes gene_type:complete
MDGGGYNKDVFRMNQPQTPIGFVLKQEKLHRSGPRDKEARKRQQGFKFILNSEHQDPDHNAMHAFC